MLMISVKVQHHSTTLHIPDGIVDLLPAVVHFTIVVPTAPLALLLIHKILIASNQKVLPPSVCMQFDFCLSAAVRSINTFGSNFDGEHRESPYTMPFFLYHSFTQSSDILAFVVVTIGFLDTLRAISAKKK